MTHFYSDFLTWTTAAVTGTAAMMAGMDLPPASTMPAPDSVALTSAAVPGAAPEAAPQEEIPEAKLIPIAGPHISRAESLRLSDIAFASATKPAAADGPTGRVTGSTVNLRGGPGTGFPVTGRAHEGDRLAVTGKHDGKWVQVKAPDGDGPVWIYGRYFEEPADSEVAMR